MQDKDLLLLFNEYKILMSEDITISQIDELIEILKSKNEKLERKNQELKDKLKKL